jgi:hypothetical protein
MTSHAVIYEVRVKPHYGGDATRFVVERDEPIKERDLLRQLNMLYRVTRVLPATPDNDEFDFLVEAEWRAGPAQAGFNP